MLHLRFYIFFILFIKIEIVEVLQQWQILSGLIKSQFEEVLFNRAMFESFTNTGFARELDVECSLFNIFDMCQYHFKE